MSRQTNHRVFIGDARNMAELPNESVHFIVTSPPYWQLKDYGSSLQLGFNETYESYINNLNLVWSECFRVLHPGCRMCINIGDQFARSVYYGRYKIVPIRTEIIKFAETIGFDYMGAIIWQKKTTMNTTGGATVMGSYPYPRNGMIEIDYEFILIFKKLGEAPKISSEIKEASKLTKEEWKEFFSGHWYFRGERQSGHLAMFPEELPRRLIKMFSFTGEVVLDPFLGSGTTMLAAKRLGRNSIGYEINEEFIPIIKKRTGFQGRSMISDEKIDFMKQDLQLKNYENRMNQLPYIFKDSIRFNKKINSSSPRFGSKISLNDSSTTKGMEMVEEGFPAR